MGVELRGSCQKCHKTQTLLPSGICQKCSEKKPSGEQPVEFKNTILLIMALLVGVFVGHELTLRSSIPVKVYVQPSSSEVNVKVPQSQPVVNVSAAAPEIKVMPATTTAPVVNVSTPPAVVNVIRENKAEAPDSNPKPKDGRVESNPRLLEQAPDQPPTSSPFVPTKIEDLYGLADKYISSYCMGQSIDEVEFRQKWLKKYLDGLETSMQDSNSTTEQRFLNSRVIAKRGCFNMEKASREEVVEACFLLLRYRDTNLVILSALRENATPDMLMKAVAVLVPESK